MLSAIAKGEGHTTGVAHFPSPPLPVAPRCKFWPKWATGLRCVGTRGPRISPSRRRLLPRRRRLPPRPRPPHPQRNPRAQEPPKLPPQPLRQARPRGRRRRWQGRKRKAAVAVLRTVARRQRWMEWKRHRKAEEKKVSADTTTRQDRHPGGFLSRVRFSTKTAPARCVTVLANLDVPRARWLFLRLAFGPLVRIDNNRELHSYHVRAQNLRQQPVAHQAHVSVLFLALPLSPLPTIAQSISPFHSLLSHVSQNIRIAAPHTTASPHARNRVVRDPRQKTPVHRHHRPGRCRLRGQQTPIVGKE